MDIQLLSFVYSALFVTGLAVGVPMILTGAPWQGATAIILGLIGLQDAVAWSSAQPTAIHNGALRVIDLVGVIFGAIAVIAPSAAPAKPGRAYRAVLAGSIGYMSACLAFWLLFERLDPAAFHAVLSAWSKQPADAQRFVAGFSVALVVLGTFVVLLRLGKIESTTKSAWISLDVALILYLVLYRLLGATSTPA